MHIAHIVTDDSRSASGVREKIERTVKSWRSFGAQVSFVDALTGELVDDLTSTLPIGRPTRFRTQWILEQERRATRLRSVLAQLGADVVYSRQMVWSPGTERLVAGQPFFFEINGDAICELRNRSRLAAAYWRRTSQRLLGRARGVIAVTEELRENMVGSSAPSMVLGNGIDVEADVPIRMPSSPPTVLMLLGESEHQTVGAHRGIDRLATLSDHLPEYRFVVRGGRPPSRRQEQGRIEFLPRVFGSELQEQLTTATVCIGALAPHRHHLTTARALKLRTALGAGVPVIVANNDPDLVGADEIVLKIAAADGFLPKDINRIRTFIIQAFQNRNLDRSAWEFATAKFSTNAIEKQRLEFFSSTLNFDT